jgi:hypothetical protein
MATASTQRKALVDGKSGAMVTKLSSVTLVMLPMPLSPEVEERYKIQSPRKGFVTGIRAAVDILNGDILTVGALNYQVRAVNAYTEPVVYTELIIEQVLS